MSTAQFLIESHRLTSDARQYGLWCFGITVEGNRWVIAYAMPASAKGAAGWTVYRARSVVRQNLSRDEASKLLHELGTAALTPPARGGAR